MDILSSIENVQKNVDEINKSIDWVQENEIGLLLAIFAAVVLAVIIGNLITK